MTAIVPHERILLRPAQTVRASTSVDGLVLLDLDGGLVLTSNPVGARIWGLIEQGIECGEIARHISADYDVPLARAEHDVAAFVAELIARGLVSREPVAQ